MSLRQVNKIEILSFAELLESLTSHAEELQELGTCKHKPSSVSTAVTLGCVSRNYRQTGIIKIYF